MSWEERQAAGQPHDGRLIDTSLGALEGEGSRQRQSREEGAGHGGVWRQAPTRESALETTYYEKPALKQPVWEWPVPLYFYVGGVAGAAMTLAMATQLAGPPRLRRFEEHLRWTGAIGGGIGSALLIRDLGRPGRFLFMLRVFRPTSPMSVGSWVLASATPLSAGSALLTMSGGAGRRLGDWLGLQAGVLGMPLATYTGVLLGNSAVPLWQETRRTLPLLFGASSVATLGSLYQFFRLGPRERSIVDAFGAAGQIAELAAASALEREARRVPGLDRPLREGAGGALWKTAKVCTAASLVVSLLPGFRGQRTLAGVLGTLGGLCLRFGMVEAGKQSAADPRATFRQQRAGHGAAELTGRPAISAPPRPLPQPRTRAELLKV